MLELFRVPEADRVYIAQEQVRQAIETIFLHIGMDEEGAQTVADVLITNDLRGVESHGVSNELRSYVKEYAGQGREHLNPRPQYKIVRETDCTATVDADWALGSHVSPWAMRLAIEKAEKHGVGAITIYNSGHISGTGYHAMLAAEAGMLGHVMSAGHARSTIPTWGAKPLLGTNAVAWAAPAREMPPFLFDIATTQVAGNKLNLTRRTGAKLHPGWIANTEGEPIMEEILTPPPGEYYNLHFGGTRENGSHKGFGVALVNEIFTNELSGLGPGPFMKKSGGHFLVAYNIEAFTDREKFLDDMDALLKEIVNTPPVKGQERVIYPGLVEAEQFEERSKHGIPYHYEVVEWLNNHLAGIGATLRLG